nr:uncharacterized protein LOC117228373 [Megalopta genalis]
MRSYEDLVKKLMNPEENDYVDGKQQIKDIIVREIEEHNSNLAQVKYYIKGVFHKLSSIDDAYIDRKYVECCSKFWITEVVDTFKELTDNKSIGIIREVFGSLDGIEMLEDVPDSFKQLRYHRLLTDPHKLVSKEDEKALISRFKEECLERMVACVDSAQKELDFLDTFLDLLSTSENRQSIIVELELEDFRRGELSFDELLERIIDLDTNTYGVGLATLKKAAECLQQEQNLFLVDKLKEVICAYTAPATTRVVKLDGRLVVQVTGRNIVVSEFLFGLENALLKNSDIEEVRLVAGDTIHIDVDLKNEVWHGKNLVILTKTMKVHDRVTCDVSGKDSDHSYDDGGSANAGTGEDGHGKEGKDGYAGESGGNVLILAGKIENFKNFIVISNGGKGSKGQDGGNGKNGKNGEGIEEADFHEKFPPVAKLLLPRKDAIATIIRNMAEDLSLEKTVWVNGAHITFEKLASRVETLMNLPILDINEDMFIETQTSDGCKITFSMAAEFGIQLCQSFLLYEGSPGQPGGHGGEPGLGGEGGYAGEIIVRNKESGQEFDIVRKAERGEEGENGKRGRPGNPGENGWDMGNMDYQVSGFFTESWPKFFGTDRKSKCRLRYYDGNKSNRVWCTYEKRYAEIVATQIENRKQRECDRKRETRRNSGRQHHAQASRKKNISEDSILATYSDRLSCIERDILQSLRSDLGSSKQQALRAIHENQEQQRKETMELGVKRHVNFIAQSTNKRRADAAPSATYKEAANVHGLIDELKREPDLFDNWLQLRGIELNRNTLDELFSMFDTVKQGFRGKSNPQGDTKDSKLQGIEQLLIEKYRLTTLEEIAKLLPVYQEITDDVELTPESAARYLVEDKEKPDSLCHPVLGAFNQYLYEDSKEQREKISRFCEKELQSDNGNREILKRSLTMFIFDASNSEKARLCVKQFHLQLESIEDKSLSDKIEEDEVWSTVDDRDPELLKEYHDHIKIEGPFSESYRVLLAYAFGINIRLYVENEHNTLSLEENHNPLSERVVHVLHISDGFVQLTVDNDYFQLEESSKRGDDLYGRVLARIDTFERKQEFDDYLARRAFLSRREDERLDRPDCNEDGSREQQDIIEISEYFPTEKRQLIKRLEIMTSQYTGKQGILRNISKRFSSEGCHVSSLELYCLLNSILRCIVDDGRKLNTFRWIVDAHPQRNWIDELILLQFENYFRRRLPEKREWRGYLSQIGNKNILLSFYVKLELCTPGSSISTKCVGNVLYLLSIIADEAIDLEGLGLSEWSHALKEKYWSRRLFRLTDWRVSEMLPTATYYLLSIENTFGAVLVKEFLDILETKRHGLSADAITDFLANFHNEKWHLSREELAMLTRCNIAEWTRRMQQKFVADEKDRNVAQLVKLIKANANSSTGITGKLTEIEKCVQNISNRNYAIAGGKSVASYTEYDIKNSLKRYPSTIDEIKKDTAMEMLAVIVRAIELKRGFKLRDTQKLTVLALLANKRTLAQVSTGEGKSLIVVAASIMKALCRKKVDIITSSSVLAKRDAEENSDIYGLFNVNVSHNCSEDIEERKKAYSGNQVVYGDLSNFQRDYLLDKFYGRNILGDRNFENVIVDEVDSMLLDKGNNVLYLSHDLADFDKLESVYVYIWQWINRPAGNTDELLNAFDGEAIKEAVLDDLFGLVRCKDIEKLGPDLSEQHRKIIWERLITAGILNGQGKLLDGNIGKDRLKIIIGPEFSDYQDRLGYLLKETAEREKLIKVPNHLRPFIERHLESWIKSAITAFLMKADQDYVVDVDRTGTSPDRDPNVTILDRDTGTDQANSQWDEALHQFLQLKHGCKLSLQSLKAVFVSNVSFLKLYRNLYGLTGTLGSPSERALLKKIHGVDFVTIPTARSKQFHEDKAILCTSKREWKDRIYNEVRKRTEKRSVLIICETVNDVEILRTVFDRKDVKSVRTYTRDYEKFDAGCDGKRLDGGHIIIATNLAGRGTDIKITKALAEAGGLHVCLTYLPRNIRIEQQAFGRAARSGEKGSGQLIVVAVEGQAYSNLKIVDLKIERNADELRRISEIKSYYETQITVEEDCFNMFKNQYERLKKNLDKDKVPAEVKEILLHSCLDKWAFWLDENNRRIKDLVNDRGIRSFYELMNEFISKLKCLERDSRNWSAWVRGNPVQTIKLGKYLCQHQPSTLDKAVELFDQVIGQVPEFSEAAHYYKAFALAKKIDWEEEPLDETNKAILKMMKEELREAGRLFDERTTAAMTATGIIAKIKKNNNESIIQIDAYEKQQRSLLNLYCVFIQSIDDILGHVVTPQSFVNDDVKEELAEALYEDFLREGTLTKPRIKDDVSDEELEQVCAGYGISAKTLKDFLSEYKGRTISEEKFQKALKNQMRLPSRSRFWKSLIDERVLYDEVKYVIVDNLNETDPLLSDVSTVVERLQKHTLESESDKGEIFLYAERIVQHKNNANVFKKGDFVKAVGDDKYRALKKKGLLSLNRKARIDKDKIGSVGFSQCDSITLEDFTEINIVRNEAERILEELVKRNIIEKKDRSENSVYGLKVQFDGIYQVQMPFCPVYENAVKCLLGVRFAYRIALQKIAKQFEEKNFPVRIQLMSKSDRSMTLELLQQGIIVPATVTTGDLDANVRSLYKLPATDDNLMDMLSQSIPISKERTEALFHHLVDKRWILQYHLAQSIEEKGVRVINEIPETVTNVAVSKFKNLYSINGSGNEREPLDSSYKDFEDTIRKIFDRRLVLAKEDTMKNVINTLESLRSALISLEVPSIKLKCLAEFSGEGEFANIVEVHVFFLNSLDYVLQFEEKRWSRKMLFNIAMVVLIGTVQIVIGAMIELFSAGTFTHLAAGFISEGVNDIFYAGGALWSGYFSWKNYRQQKFESVIMTAITVGVGAYFSSGAKVSYYGHKLAGPGLQVGGKVAETSGIQLIKIAGCKWVGKELAKRIVSKVIEGLVFGFANTMVDSLIENQLREFCRYMSSEIILIIERCVGMHDISTSLKEAYKTLGAKEATNLIDKLTKSAFSEKSYMQEFLPAVKSIANSVIQGIANAAEKRSMTSNTMQFPIRIISIGAVLLEHSLQIVDMALVTSRFLNHLNEEIKSELRKHADRCSPVREQEAEDDCERFKNQIIAMWQKLLRDQVGQKIEQNIVGPILKAGVNRIIRYAGQMIAETYRSYKESLNSKYFDNRTQEYREELENTEQQQHDDVSKIKEQIEQKYQEDIKQLLEKTRCPRLFAKAVRENIPMDMVCISASLECVTGFLKQQGIDIPGITIVVTGEGGIRQTFSSAPEGANVPIIYLEHKDNHYRLSGSGESETRGSGGSMNDCLRQALSEGIPELRNMSRDDFRNGVADQIERDPKIQNHIKQGWHALPLRHGVFGGGNSRRKRQRFVDDSSSTVNNGLFATPENPSKKTKKGKKVKKVKKVAVHFFDRFKRTIRLAGAVQKIAEMVTGMSRSEIIKAGASQSTDGSSGLGSDLPSAHVLRFVINSELKKNFEGIYNNLDTFLAHTQIVPRYANDWHGMGGAVDRCQGEIYEVLVSIDFNKEMTSEATDKIKGVQKKYTDVLNKEREKLINQRNVSCEQQRAERIFVLGQSINFLNNISVEELFEKGCNGYKNEDMITNKLKKNKK